VDGDTIAGSTRSLPIKLGRAAHPYTFSLATVVAVCWPYDGKSVFLGLVWLGRIISDAWGLNDTQSTPCIWPELSDQNDES
jgi:hypothetical protein